MLVVVFNKIIIIVLFLIVFPQSAYTAENQTYTYKVRKGDTLSEITLIFTGTLNYMKIAKANRINNPDFLQSIDF